MLYFKQNPGPPPTNKPPWKHELHVLNLVRWAAAISIAGVVIFPVAWVLIALQAHRNFYRPDPATWPLERMNKQIKFYGLPVTAERMIYIDLDDDTYVWEGKIKPNTWLARLAKPDGKVHDLSSEGEVAKGYLFVRQEPNKSAILAVTSYANHLEQIREKMMTKNLP